MLCEKKMSFFGFSFVVVESQTEKGKHINRKSKTWAENRSLRVAEKGGFCQKWIFRKIGKQ